MPRKNKEQKPEGPGVELLRTADAYMAMNEEAVRIGEAAVELAKRTAENARFTIGAALSELMSDPRVLSAAEVAELATDFPQWTIQTGITGGQARKSYTRRLDDVHPMVRERRDFNHRFTDPEYFDLKLTEIFDTWDRDGDTGSFPHFTLSIDEARPITAGDMWKVTVAEQYLHEEGLFSNAATYEQIQAAS